MTAQDKTITPDELLQMPDDGMRREIHDGVLVEMSPSGKTSTRLAAYLLHLLSNYVFEHDLGHLAGADGGFILSEDPYVLLSPDVAFISKDHPESRDEGFYNHAPDLAVEVISPSERATDIDVKTQKYLDYGTRLLWVIYPKTQRVVVYTSGLQSGSTVDINGTLDGGDVLPGFTLSVRDIFAALDK
jgi:Uma2 family endonuclease